MTKPTLAVVLLTTMAIAGARSAQAQGASSAESKGFLNVDLGAQPQQRTLATSTSFPLYDETATVSSSQPVHNGPMFGITGGYRIRPKVAVGVGVTMFNARTADSTIVATIPDLVFFNRPKTITQIATGLDHSELGVHLSAVWLHTVSPKIDMALSAGPSLIRVKQDLTSSVTVTPGTQNIVATQETQTGNALGFNAGFDGTYKLAPTFGVGLFVRYAGGKVTLPAVTGLQVGGLQAGLGVRLHF